MLLLKRIFRITLPWLGFSLAARYTPDRWIDLLWAVFLLSQIVISRRQLKAGNPMSWAATALLTCLFANGYFNLFPWVNDHATGLCFMTFALTACLSVLLGAPFTLSHAKASVPPQFWSNPLFIQINRVISLFWGLAYALDALIILLRGATAPVLSQVACMSCIVGAVVFSEYYPAQMRKRAAAAAATAS
jgi:hypothetical protein